MHSEKVPINTFPSQRITQLAEQHYFINYRFEWLHLRMPSDLGRFQTR